jgi:aminoglycoside/choline kinase family phosphotransferase
MMQQVTASNETHPLALFEQATDTLLLIQQVKPPAWLGNYDEALLRRELGLFDAWYVQAHLQQTLTGAQQQKLQGIYDLLVQRNLASPKVFVHRDYMPRNLMVSDQTNPPALGVLDFQHAVQGPVTYDIASLMRDAFVSWDEAFCLDVTVRYWHKARAAGLLDFEDWHADFGAFYRAVEWMGLQRHLKVAGIFARLTLRDHKPKYLADAPRFIHYIRATAARYNELSPLLRLLDELHGDTPASTYVFGRP